VTSNENEHQRKIDEVAPRPDEGLPVTANAAEGAGGPATEEQKTRQRRIEAERREREQEFFNALCADGVRNHFGAQRLGNGRYCLKNTKEGANDWDSSDNDPLPLGKVLVSGTGAEITAWMEKHASVLVTKT
jgi:hypothetical protein